VYSAWQPQASVLKKSEDEVGGGRGGREQDKNRWGNQEGNPKAETLQNIPPSLTHVSIHKIEYTKTQNPRELWENKKGRDNPQHLCT
jgi:hypothetical protein